MRLFLALVAFELRFYLRRISTHVYFLLFFGISLFFGFVAGGGIPGAAAIFTGAGGIVHCNSPYAVASLIGAVGLFAVPVVTAVMGNAVYRDYEAGIHPLFFTTPVSKAMFLGSRFTGAFLVNAWIFVSIPLGLAASLLLPNIQADQVGPFRTAFYAQPYLVMLLPTLVVTGAIFFSLAAMTRKMLPNYLGGVILLIGYILAGSLLSDIENKTLAALVDPFGGISYDVVAEYWTAAERNTKLIPLAGIVGVNRLIWIAVGLSVLALSAWRFRFAHVVPGAGGLSIFGRFWSQGAPEPEGRGIVPGMALQLPDPPRDFSWRADVRQLGAVIRRSFVAVVLNVYFLAIALAGLLFLVFTATLVGRLYGTPTWPMTYQVLEAMGGLFAAFTVVLIALFAGDLAWHERDLKVQQLVDATPMPTWVPFVGKVSALILVVACLQVVVLIAGVTAQLARGFHDIDLLLYVKVLFGVYMVSFALTVILAFVVHVIVNQKYLGHVVFLLSYFGMRFLPALGFEHKLYRYGSDTGWTWSDMNRFGPFLEPWSWYKLYWVATALVLAVLVNVLWVRGQEQAPGRRLDIARRRLAGPAIAIAAGAALAALMLGGWIFWNTNVRNEYRTSFQQDERTAEYERIYKKHESLPQPRVVGVNVEADLFPKTGGADFRGTYRMANKTDGDITEVHVLVPEEAIIQRIEFTPPAALEMEDEDRGYRIFRLAAPLLPGGTLECAWAVSYTREGFTNSGPSTAVVENGTFVNSEYLPSFGYHEGVELSGDSTRKKHGLEPKERMARVDDMQARRNNYISRDADWVTFEATVSTDVDQIALAPGYLERDWTEGGRRFFHYTMDRPILDFYAFLSARYTVKRDTRNDVAIEVYYHPGHEYNLDTMIQAVKKSLDYYTREFGPYQHRQVRIVEFPRYATFAQSFPNTIPFSEGIGFVARLDRKTNIDYPFYVTAHEVAHQWWAHQVIGGNVQGSTLLSESMSQYSALMVMEDELGPDQMRRFLGYELYQYLVGRATERKKEPPLALNENQSYIHYNKGSVVMYALKDYLGEETLNGAIRGYLERVKYQEPPYTNSLEFVDAIRAVTPPELASLVDDLFMTITLWDLRAKDATVLKTSDGKWAVTLTYEARKYRADEIGNQTEQALDMPVDIGIFSEGDTSTEDDDKPLMLEKRRVVSGEGTITVVVDEKPVRAGIDPYHKLIDRKSDDNVVKVKDAAPPAS